MTTRVKEKHWIIIDEKNHAIWKGVFYSLKEAEQELEVQRMKHGTTFGWEIQERDHWTEREKVVENW